MGDSPLEHGTIMFSSDDRLKDSSETSPAVSPAILTPTSSATSEDPRLEPLFGHVKWNPDAWSNFVTPEPISEELREKVRTELLKDWYASRLCPEFRRNTLVSWVWFDNCRIVLDNELGEIDTLCEARRFCNRPAGFYWPRDPLEAVRSPNTIFACIFSEWHRQYDDQPNLDFDHFVANPIRIAEGGPDTIRGMIKAHISLYAKAEEILRGGIHGPGGDVNSASHTGDFSIHPLYPALVLTCDKDDLTEVYKDYKRPDDYVRLRDFMHLQNLIIARTGCEHMLSKPISFESLQSQALPLDRADFDGEANVDVIRVPLPAAIRFVVDLEKREDAFMYQKTGSVKNPMSYRVSLRPEAASLLF